VRAVAFAGTLLGKNQHVGLAHVIRSRPEPDFMMTEAAVNQIKSNMTVVFGQMIEQLVESGLQENNISAKIINDSSSRAGSLLEEASRNNYDTKVPCPFPDPPPWS